MKNRQKKRVAHSASRTALSLAIATALIASGAAANAVTTDPNPGALETRDSALSARAATDGMVLLENHDSVLPLSATGNVALFGLGSYKTIKGGTGSGAVNNRSSVTVRQGLTNAGYSLTTNSSYAAAIQTASTEPLLTATTVQPAAPTDTAVFVLSRNSGEGADRSKAKGDYLLSDNELANITLLGSTYKKVIIVLNVGGIVDTQFFKTVNAAVTDPSGGQALDSMLLMSQAGQEGGNAVASVLKGDVTPSGKLTDTWASKYAYYPAASTFASADGNALQEQYTEGLYVGYRYFDSLYRVIDPANTAGVVNYPFGFGLSYSNFKVEARTVTADMDTVTVTARVTNTGTTYSGKDVVEVYVSAPQTGLDKPYQQLAGYGKTDVLAPGASQTVTVSFKTSDLAAYNETTSAYTLDAGDYLVRVGDSSRNTSVAAKLHLDATTNTQQLAAELNDARPVTELTSDPANFYSYAAEAAEISAAPSVTLNTSGFIAPNNASAFQQDVTVDSSSPYYAIDGSKISSITAYVDPSATNWEGTGAPYAPRTGETVAKVATSSANTLFDVQAGRITMQQFVAGLSVTQLANLVEGSSIAGGTTDSAVGAAGYTTARYESLGIPGMTLADGPAGLRITQQIAASATTPASYQFGTAWPIGTLLAQTWNTDLVKEVAVAVGNEMREYGVTLWLAPGMNIHRDPLNGRNFEYYSEDPLVSGLTASATIEGVQSVPGRGVTIKHYMANNQETSRTTTNAVISERAIREIYLKGFEIAVRGAQPMAVMTSYNKINGTYASGSYDLDTDILRGEWGFKGLIMTDWGAGPRTGAVGVMYAGNDLIEPGANPAEIINATVRQAPSIDVSGLPAYQKLITTSRTTYTWSFNGLTPSATGASTASTTVNSTTDLSKVSLSGTTTRDAINNEVYVANPAFASVQAAYADASSWLSAATGLTAAQKAGITITNVVRQSATDSSSPVVSYQVNVRGNYAASVYTMRLGDLQRSASRILNVAMQTADFGQLAASKGVQGVTIGSYTGQFADLVSFVKSHTSNTSAGNSAAVVAAANLGSAASFSVLAGAAATVPGSTISGDIGAGEAVTVSDSAAGGVVHASADAATGSALFDLGTAYAKLKALVPTASLTSDDLGGQTILPGVYHRDAALAATTTVTFDARDDVNAIFVIQSDAALNTTAATTMVLKNGAKASNIFWVTTGATTLGAASTFQGNIISNAAITVGAGSSIFGRLLSVTAAVTLDATTVASGTSAR